MLFITRVHHNTTNPPIALLNVSYSSTSLATSTDMPSTDQETAIRVAWTSGIAEYEYISGTTTTAPDITYAGGAVK